MEVKFEISDTYKVSIIIHHFIFINIYIEFYVLSNITLQVQYKISLRSGFEQGRPYHYSKFHENRSTYFLFDCNCVTDKQTKYQNL